MAARSPFTRRKAELAKLGVTVNLYTSPRRTRAGAVWTLTVKAGDLVVNRDLRAAVDDQTSAEAEALTMLVTSPTRTGTPQ